MYFFFFFLFFFFFFFNDTATTEIYTLSLHDALPIWSRERSPPCGFRLCLLSSGAGEIYRSDRKSTRLNSSHVKISYAVFCLKKKKKKKNNNKYIKKSKNIKYLSISLDAYIIISTSLQ